jgi:tetratricopeptide (TPR) repeat protein
MFESTAPFAIEPGLESVVGAQIGRYTIRNIVAFGGMGLVVAAHDAELGRLVAIKLVSSDSGQARRRLVREAQAMAQLSHPNVVTVHEVIWFGDRAGIVMELVDGDNLATWRDSRPRTWREIVAAYTQAARGLAAAHRAGLVHRDFKPSNALINRDGIVRVTDFGLVRAARASSATEPAAEPVATAAGAARPSTTTPSVDLEQPGAEAVGLGALHITLTQTGAMMGTPAFMAPEQHAGGDVDARSDQWALGCSLYSALYGQRPFAGATHLELAASVQAGAIRPEPADTSVPRPIRAAVRRALALDPADRFESMDAMIDALSPRRPVWLLAAGGAAAVVAVVAAAVVLGRGEGPTCTGLGAPIDAVWNQARSSALRARFAAIGGFGDDSAADRVVSDLDRYSVGWTGARRRACEEGRQGAGSPVLLDRRMRCLEQRLVEVAAVIDELAAADAAVARGAGAAVDQLHPVAECADPRETVPRPADAKTRAAITAAEETLARASAFYALGQCDRALPLAQEAAGVAERVAWAPLLARALLLRGVCEHRQDRYEQSVATLDRAATAAARAQDDALIAEALSTRFYVLGERLGRPADAMAGRRFIELALERAGQPRRQRALWLHTLAVVLLGQGKTDEALAAQKDATATWRQLVPAGHTNLIDSLQTQANIHSARGEWEASGKLLDEAMASEVAGSGPDHPRVAVVLTNVGLLRVLQGDVPGAVEKWERALAIQRRNKNADWIAAYNVGFARTTLGRWRDGHRELSAALASAGSVAPGQTRPVAWTSAAVGHALTSLGRLDEAQAMLARAVAAARAAGDMSVREALAYTANLALVRGDVAAARTHLAEAEKLAPEKSPFMAVVRADLVRAEKGCSEGRRAYEAALAAAKPDSLTEKTAATTGLAECLIELGDPAAAVATIEPRLAWLEQVGADPGAAARARFALARALVASRGDRERALALAESARAGFATLDAWGQKRAGDVTRWVGRMR